MASIRRNQQPSSRLGSVTDITHRRRARDFDRLTRSLVSEIVDRSTLAGKIGTTFAGKRHIDVALGYLERLSTKDYRYRYERGGIAERIIEAYPRATWSAGVNVFEDPDVENVTPFEEALYDMAKRLRLWAKFVRVDILCQLGEYAVLLIGAPGDLATPLPRMKSQEDILYLKPLGQDRAKIDSKVKDVLDKRFGLPEFYDCNLGDGVSKKIHWSRIIHVAEGCLEDEVFGKPRLRAVWNHLDDLVKVSGGGSEAAWKRADPGFNVNVDPDVEFTPEAKEKLQEQLDEYEHKLRRFVKTVGVDMKPLSTSAGDFGGNVNSLMDLISGTTGIPQRILMGSERGEQSSTQDRSNWDDRVDERKQEHASPIVEEFIDRLVENGALPEPLERTVEFPNDKKMTPDEIAGIVGKIAAANASQSAAEGVVIVTANELREKYLGMEASDETTPDPDDETDDETPPPVVPADDGDEEQPTVNTRHMSARSSEYKLVHQAADKNRRRVTASVLSSWFTAAASINAQVLENAVAGADIHEVQRIVVRSLEAAEEKLRKTLPDLLHDTMSDAGEAAARIARKRGGWFRSTRRSLDDVDIRGAAPAFQVSFNRANPRAISWAQRRAAQLVTHASAATREAIRDLVARGIADGIPPLSLARLVRQSIGLRPDQAITLERFAAGEGVTESQVARRAKKMLNARAELIARTETMRSANEGQRELWRQAQETGSLPLGSMRVWIGTDDGRERPSHVLLNGEVTGIDEPFSTGIEPGEEPNCRCGQGIATDEDIERAGR